MRTYVGVSSWSELRASVDPVLGAGATRTLQPAWELAEQASRGERRPGGEPHAEHVSEVALILLDAGVRSPAALIAGMLHDTRDDSATALLQPAERLSAEAGEQIALAARYSDVQRLHTHPEVAAQRRCYTETCESFLPVAARWPFFAELYRQWAHAYDYLVAGAVTLPTTDKIADACHRQQADKSGQPYIGHPRAVARLVRNAGGSTAQQMAGLLHDTVEDTAITLRQLGELGVPPDVLTMVDALTRRPGEPHRAYLARVAAVPGAAAVKRADIAHNASPARLCQLDPATQDRLRAKYATATAILDQLG